MTMSANVEKHPIDMGSCFDVHAQKLLLEGTITALVPQAGGAVFRKFPESVSRRSKRLRSRSPSLQSADVSRSL